MTRNFLEGARKKRVSYTPRGLYEAWWDLDAARKVYLGTMIGLVISVSESWITSMTVLTTAVASCHHAIFRITPLPRGLWILWRTYQLH
jgi:hypothetical protein